MSVERGECEICFEIKWVFECGADNNCNVKICDICFVKNPVDWDGYSKVCMFCRSYDIKKAVLGELEDRVWNEFDDVRKCEEVIARAIFLSRDYCYECDEI